MWQFLAERLEDGQSADTRIEHPNRIVTGNHLRAGVVLHSTFDNRGASAAYYHVRHRGNDRRRGHV
jgi:hypothetical protein